MAVRIIELARRGERDPEQLRDRVLRESGTAPFSRRQQVLDAAAQLAQSESDSSA
jgi:hypothetical protein